MRFKEQVAEIMQRYGVPGLTMIIVRDSQISYLTSLGSADYESQRPIDQNTLFGIGSVSKSFTALAILKLHEEGVLDINDPISKYLPIKRSTKEEQITIKHLLTHSSGIPDLGVLSLLLDIACNRREEIPIVPLADEEDLILHINEALNQGTLPGDHYFYFNSGYTLLGYIIEKVSNCKFEEYVKANILIPLKMNRSTYDKEEFIADQNHASGYIVETVGNTLKLRKENPAFHPFFSAPGGLLSSAEELTHYLIMHMNGGKYDGVRIIQEKSLEIAHSEQFGGESIGIPSIDSGTRSYGFGWGIYNDYMGERYISHGGSVGVYSAHLGFFPEKNVGLIMLANVKNIPTEILMMFQAFALGKPIAQINGLQRFRYLQSLCGKYNAYKQTNSALIYLRGGVLELRIPRWKIKQVLIPQNRFDLLPTRFMVYNAFGGTSIVDFNRDLLDGTKKLNFFYERNHFIKA